MKNDEILILGPGREGQWWDRLFKEQSIPTRLVGESPDNCALVANARRILVAVPMSAIASVGQMIAAYADKRSLVISACGLMESMEDALRGFKGEAIFVHRLIGTQVESMEGYSMAVNRKFLRESADWSNAFWINQTIQSTGAREIAVTSSEHDNMVGLTQALMRIIGLSLGSVVAEAPLPARDFASAPLNGMMSVVSRIMELEYLISKDMIVENRYTSKWAHRLTSAILAVSESPAVVEDTFQKLRVFLGAENIRRGSDALWKLPHDWWQ